MKDDRKRSSGISRIRDAGSPLAAILQNQEPTAKPAGHSPVPHTAKLRKAKQSTRASSILRSSIQQSRGPGRVRRTNSAAHRYLKRASRCRKTRNVADTNQSRLAAQDGSVVIPPTAPRTTEPDRSSTPQSPSDTPPVPPQTPPQTHRSSRTRPLLRSSCSARPVCRPRALRPRPR